MKALEKFFKGFELQEKENTVEDSVAETTENESPENSFNEYYEDFPTPNYDDEAYDMLH